MPNLNRQTHSDNAALADSEKRGAEAFLKATALLEGERMLSEAGRADRYCHEAALLGHRGAQYNLGLMYAKGLGLPQDTELALLWLQHAADGGEIKASGAIDALQRIRQHQETRTTKRKI
jgi:TPR repeat protein